MVTLAASRVKARAQVRPVPVPPPMMKAILPESRSIENAVCLV
jgi:hypothetical protein